VSISGDGRYTAFYTGDAPQFQWDIFVHDLLTGSTVLASISSAGDKGNSDSWTPYISADGSVVAFHSTATNLVVEGNGQYPSLAQQQYNRWQLRTDVFTHQLR